MELSCGSKSEKGALGKRKLLQARVTFPRGNQSSDQQGYLSLLDGATLQMHRKGGCVWWGGGGIHTHTHTDKSLDKPDKSQDKYGDFNHWKDCTFSEPSEGKERRKPLRSIPVENASCARWSHESCPLCFAVLGKAGNDRCD